ncbi:MAG TPA: flagellar basal body rod protein FlgC [Steroidobacteraceae bacterium]|nr:flagellar basal body rod protein FlgC [Steroidobacteraceae bacterium]
MDLFSVFDISAAGMSVEQQKLAVTAANIANERTAQTADGSVYKPLSVSVYSSGKLNYNDIAQSISASELPRPVVAGVIASNAPPRLVYDPGHPNADERGFVTLPAVDPVGSMMELMSIRRAYEANIQAFDITRTLIQQTIDMGKAR